MTSVERFVTSGLLITLAAGAGCNQPLFGPAPASAPGSTLTLDRMVKTYPELASKKFQVIADFETPAQATLFHREPPRGGGTVEMTTQQSRRETGVGALKISFTDSSQQVLATDTPEGEWSLFRDWTPYHLLIFSVFSPRALGGFHFSVRSGTDVPLTYTQPRIALEPGWNLVRIDLGILSDQVNLADVREMRFWCDPLESPVDLYLDDILLVNNATQIFGPAQPTPGDLFVRSEGQRLVVGAAERFELVFTDGVIRQWFDLSSDSLLARNLTAGQPLGPVPIGVPDSTDALGFPESMVRAATPPPGIEARQELVEASPLRVVIRGEWRAHAQEGTGDAGVPARSWQYAVYRDGRIYVAVTGTSRDIEGPNGMGVAFCCDADAGFKPTVVESGAEAAGPGGHDPYALFSRAEPGKADLLIVPYGPGTVSIVRHAEDPRVCALWRLQETEARFSFTCLLRVWPADIDAPAQAVPMVGDYRHPLPMLVDTGGLARNDPGDFDGDGFSEGRGYYLLQLDGSIAKVRVVGRPYMRFSPAFRLTSVANRDVWVYVDGRQIEIQRGREGDVFFEVAGAISNDVLVEVTSREKGLQ